MIGRKPFLKVLLVGPAAFAAVVSKPRVSRAATAGLLMIDESPGVHPAVKKFYSHRTGDTVLFDNTGRPSVFTSGTVVVR